MGQQVAKDRKLISHLLKISMLWPYFDALLEGIQKGGHAQGKTRQDSEYLCEDRVWC